MFGMGLTLEWKDFLEVWRQKRIVGAGVAAQYCIMPLLALGLGALLGLEQEVLIGVVIVGACPGGTASNVITYLAKGNVALSVTITLVSTALAPLLTPLIIFHGVGESVDIPLIGMMKSVFWIVLFPIVDGLLLRRLFKTKLDPLLKIFPSISIATISVVIAIIMALNQERILDFPVLIATVVILHNSLGLLTGYGVGILLGSNEIDRRTLAIEIGMQNSGLGASLATSFFTPLAALPSALFSLWHNLSGIGLAQIWTKDHEST